MAAELVKRGRPKSTNPTSVKNISKNSGLGRPSKYIKYGEHFDSADEYLYSFLPQFLTTLSKVALGEIHQVYVPDYNEEEIES